VDREHAIAELHLSYAVALRLRDVDADDETIARALGIEPEGIAALLRIAEAKLSARLARGAEDDPPGDAVIRPASERSSL
jgi:hypothetical protein